MKALWNYAIVIVATAAAVQAKDFVNLDFEDGVWLPFQQLQPVDSILPGWTARIGDHIQAEVTYAFGSRPGADITVMPSLWDSVEGRLGVRLAGGPETYPFGPIVTASISQSGTIPVGSRSLLFRGSIHDPSEFEVRLGDRVVPYLYLSGPYGLNTYGVDVSSLAGQELELRLSGFAAADGFSGLIIDSFRFSTTAVPEPSTWAMFGLGLAALAWTIGRHDPGHRAPVAIHASRAPGR